MNPLNAIPHLKEMLNHFEGNVYSPPNGTPYQTNGGPEKVQETIDYLSNLKSP